MNVKQAEILKDKEILVDENRSFKGKIEMLNLKIENLEKENTKLYR